jgi:hypothetical protein
MRSNKRKKVATTFAGLVERTGLRMIDYQSKLTKPSPPPDDLEGLLATMPAVDLDTVLGELDD